MEDKAEIVKTEPRVAVLFQRFGPYHHARLNAAGRLMPVWGLEACAMEDTYAWARVEGAAAFTKVTLTERSSGDRHWKQKLQHELWHSLDEIKPHVVVVPGWSSAEALSALRWCGKTVTPPVVMSESTAWDERRVAWKEWIKGRLVKLNSAGLAGGVPQGDYLAQLGLPREHVFSGYDVVDNDYFATRAAEARSQELVVRGQKSEVKISHLPTLHLPSSPFFLASARFVEKKNLSRLIEAYARYRELAEKAEIERQKTEIGSQEPGDGRWKMGDERWKPEARPTPDIWSLVLLGDGPLRSSIFDLRSSLGLDACVHLPGFKQYEELPLYFGLAGAFVHASTTEQWGLVVNEAMASGLPVLVSNRCGCARDLVQEGVNGFQFDPCNVEQLAQLMLRVSDSRFPVSDFGAASRRIISAWGPERFANGLRDAVTIALKNPRPRPGALDWLLLRLICA